MDVQDKTPQAAEKQMRFRPVPHARAGGISGLLELVAHLPDRHG